MNPHTIALLTPRIAYLLCASARPARALVRRRVASARGAKRLWRKSIFLVGALKRRPRPRKKRSELIRETSAPLWGQNVRHS